jgi:hypothetical protein
MREGAFLLVKALAEFDKGQSLTKTMTISFSFFTEKTLNFKECFFSDILSAVLPSE